MNKKSLLLFLSILSFTTFAFAQVQLQFITINQHGNNLFLDNFSFGSQYGTDVGILSINNIATGTNYALSLDQFSIKPSVTILNLGKNNVTSAFTVTMTTTPGGYSNTKTVESLSHGQSMQVVFDSLTLTFGVSYKLVVTLNLAGDVNSANNVLTQTSKYYAGVHRTLLLENFVSSNCTYCGANNPTTEAFINSKFDSIVSIKYHMSWPSPGDDPMYLYNTTQNLERKDYYGVSSTPTIIMDGLVEPPFPYTLPYSLPNSFNSRQPVGTPTKITVTNTRLPGDTIRADITVQNISALPTGTYYLRVCAVERVVKYATAPGKNGEKVFYDVFRAAYPNSQGTSISTAAGTYNLSIKYHLDMSVWKDTSIYTAAFIQNEATGEVLNAAKSRHYTAALLSEIKPDPIVLESPVNIFPAPTAASNFQFELFENKFLPNGWDLTNPDGDVTFNQYKGVNGPTLGGNTCVILPCFYYTKLNAADTLYSNVYNSLTNYDSVKFDYAYAPRSGNNDRLIVKLSTDGGITFPTVIFDKMGSALATTSATSNSFIPSSPSEWAAFSYPVPLIPTPVELNSFTALLNGNSVFLKWNTASEINNLGFHVQRSSDKSNYYTVGFIKGNGSSNNPHSYSFVDKSISGSNAIYYRLKQVDCNGKFTYSNVVEVNFNTRIEYALNQNYPNPFNPVTSIQYSVKQTGFVKIELYDMLGRRVETLVNEEKQPGNYSFVFNASALASSVYFYKLESGSFTAIKKMTVLK